MNVLHEQMKRDQEKLARLKSLVAEGLAQLDQGLGIEINSEEELDAFMDRLSAEAAENVMKRSQSSPKNE